MAIGFEWLIHQEPYVNSDGTPVRERPNAIVVKSKHFHQNAPEARQQQQQKIDVYNWLTIEVEPPSQDTPQSWQTYALLRRYIS